MLELNHTAGKSLVRTMANENLANTLGSISETSLDAMLSNGLLRDIPIIGTMTGMLKVGRDIRNELYLKKICVFLSNIAIASSELRESFSAQFDSEDSRHRFGEAILLLLERSDDMEKPKIIGKIMRAAIQNSIELPKAMRLCAIVNRCYIQDLDFLLVFEEGPQFADMTAIVESLQSVGLLSTHGFDGGDLSSSSKSGVIYKLNSYGELLLEYGLCDVT